MKDTYDPQKASFEKTADRQNVFARLLNVYNPVLFSSEPDGKTLSTCSIVGCI